MPELKTKFGMRMNNMSKDIWEFGISFQRQFDEIYLNIQLFFVGVSIGKFYDFDEWEGVNNK